MLFILILISVTHKRLPLLNMHFPVNGEIIRYNLLSSNREIPCRSWYHCQMKYGIKGQIVVYIYRFDTFSEYKYWNEMSMPFNVMLITHLSLMSHCKAKLPDLNHYTSYLPYIILGFIVWKRALAMNIDELMLNNNQKYFVRCVLLLSFVIHYSEKGQHWVKN